MKKIFALAFVAVCAFSLVAAEKKEKAEAVVVPQDEALSAPQSSAVWPAFFAVGEIPATPDLIGLRLTIPYSTKQESVTGFDLGFWGRSQYFEGIQINIFRNDVRDQGTGFQVGIYNSIGEANLLGVQVGLWNEAGEIRGVQAGLVNTAGIAQGFQIGLINRADEMYGFQVGAINVIRCAELSFMPILNIGF